MRALLIPALALLAMGCSASDSTSEPPDGVADAGSVDAASTPTDVGLADVGLADAALADAALADAALADAALADAAPDAAAPDPSPLTGDSPHRPAPVVLPDGAEPWPVVLLLGGYDYFSSDLDAWIEVSARVAADGFLLIMPDGTVDQDGSPFWNATDTCCDFYGTGVDDTAYLLSLLAEADARYTLDHTRIITLGHSNGGFMGYRLACAPHSPVTAVVSVAGSGWIDPGRCDATHAVSVLQIHGDADDIMPISGDNSAPGAMDLMERWGIRGNCTEESWAEAPDRLDLLADDNDADTTQARYTEGCDPGIDVALWTLAGADHYPEFWSETTDTILDWALRR